MVQTLNTVDVSARLVDIASFMAEVESVLYFCKVVLYKLTSVYPLSYLGF